MVEKPIKNKLIIMKIHNFMKVNRNWGQGRVDKAIKIKRKKLQILKRNNYVEENGSRY